MEKSTPIRYSVKRCVVGVIFLIFWLTGGLNGASTWTGGAGDFQWGSSSNWLSIPEGLPYLGAVGGDPDSIVFFGEGQLILTNGNSVQTINLFSLDFQSAGWAIGANSDWIRLRGSSSVPTFINSQGIGVNTIFAPIQIRTGPSTWAVASGNTLYLTGANEPLALSNHLIKTGAGTLVIDKPINPSSVTTSIAGTVRVEGGTVLINSVSISKGELTDDEAGGAEVSLRHWYVGAGAVLGGTGKIIMGGAGNALDPNRLINVYGTLAPGGDGTNIGGPSIGSLSFHSMGASNVQSRIVMKAGSTLAMDLSATDGVSDRLVFTRDGLKCGNLDLNAGNVTLSLAGPAFDLIAGNSYILATFPTVPADSPYGTFSSMMYNGVDVTHAGLFTINYTNTAITLFAIPEPSHLGSIALGGLLFLVKKRRRISALAAA